MSDDRINYRDLIGPDDSIEKLISQLSELGNQYSAVIDAIKTGATQIAQSMKAASGATSEGRRSIDSASLATDRLARAQEELKFALSETGKQVAWLKAQTADVNKTSVEQQKALTQAITSYDRLKSELKDLVTLYKSLTAAERADSEMGEKLLNDIVNLKDQIRALDDAMKPHIRTITDLERAEQRLAYLQTEEGKRLIEIRQKIAEITGSRRRQQQATDALTQAQERLAYAQSSENEELQLYSIRIAEANRMAKLQAQIANSAEGSYDRLSAQYALNKIRLNQMSQAERENTEAGRDLVEQTKEIYEQMIKLQEATGNHRLSVGNYARTWDGLGNAVSQVVRELPAASVSLNTFFLAISNNIPILIDEINRLRAANAAAVASGANAVNITRAIITSLLSWQTALIVLITLLSECGVTIFEWAKKMVLGRDYVIKLDKAIQNIIDTLKKNTNSYGDSRVELRKLTDEYSKLKTEMEKIEFIKKNASEFDSLGISIKTVNDAEIAFISSTKQLEEAFAERARAAAAFKLAADEYDKFLTTTMQAKAIEEGGKIPFMLQFTSEIEASREIAPLGTLSYIFGSDSAEARRRKYIVKELKKEAYAADSTAKQYTKLALAYDEAGENYIKLTGLKESKDVKAIEKADKKANKRKREGRDLTDIINKNDVRLEDQLRKSETALIIDEYKKRQRAILDSTNHTHRELMLIHDKNLRYLANKDKKYKALSPEQRKKIETQQGYIGQILDNLWSRIAIDLDILDREREKALTEQALKSAIIATSLANRVGLSDGDVQALTQNLKAVDTALSDELKLAQKHLDDQYAIVRYNNEKLKLENSEFARSDEDITIEHNKKKLELQIEYDLKMQKLQERNVEDSLQLVRKGTSQELALIIQKNEIARKIALSQNLIAPATEQVSSSTINQQFDQYRSLAIGSFTLNQFEALQAAAEANFRSIEQNERDIAKFKLIQQADLLNMQIKLAEARQLQWRNFQIAQAKETVKGIERQILEIDDFIRNVGKNGLGQTLLENLGFSDRQVDALQEAKDIVLEQMSEIFKAETELAENAVKLADKRVEAAQKAYEAELEARANGYANSVATAKAELELERKNQQDKQKLLAEAQRKQSSVDTVTQASSLVTASANLWSSFSKVPIVGPALALAAIATMWTSFAVAKAKAKQATQSQAYGDGGLEFLEGGSHASGNDIDLGVNNSKNRRMRAEGGEALAIINRKQTRKYKRVLPDVIDSLNKGVFEDKYLNAFSGSGQVNIIAAGPTLNLAKLESDVHDIRKQGETRIYSSPEGHIIRQYKNIKTVIRR